MPITPKHAFKEKSTKLLILLSLRTIYNHTYQCETPCTKKNFLALGNSEKIDVLVNSILK